ncbi:hypothetical protein A5699_10085 [Mycobacterium sp. E802]|uniref:hypothetical protein n=1 Tax=Mycobacterium sp. E802 TaxID=1834152 RepID=UPI000800E2F1|nr:hypothetical protein [Mycobacterium sp. E802]OBG80817.1 hypothetical protein A5699_10085 [Mycobacterium sp. E802]
MNGKVIFDPQHLGWALVLGPAIIVAAYINIDNRYFGPYFAVVDVVFNDFGTGYRWHDKEILLSLFRRIVAIVATGALLNLLHYQLIDIAAVFLVAGFLLIWPAFARPLPVPASKSDRHVLLVWALYIASVVLFGLFGAKLWAILTALFGKDPWEAIRENLVWGAILLVGGLTATAYRAGLQGRGWQGDWQPDNERTGGQSD